MRKLVTFCKTEKEAKSLASKLRKEGAKGVKIGKRTSRGIPVESVLFTFPWEK